jgi:Uma2 family endonuclease
MATRTLVSVHDYASIDEPAGLKYELSEGELIVTPSASFFHNKTRDYLTARLADFVERQGLGEVASETDVKLVGETVRRPDVALFCANRLRGVDLDQVPMPVAPDLVIEIVSRNDRADDLLLKVSQYLAAGVKAVWLLYPNTKLAYRYAASKIEPEVRSSAAGQTLEDPELLPGFSLPLEQIFRASGTR